MLTIVLGAPGSGKSTVARHLRSNLRHCAVLDWDDFMPAVSGLSGRDVRVTPDLWAPYAELLRSIVTALGNLPVLLFGVCTPDELADWPEARWVLLDCDDVERRRRLSARAPHEVDQALADAEAYRRLGLDAVDTTHRSVEQVADAVARAVRDAGTAGPRSTPLP